MSSSDPLERAIAEWRAKQGTVSGPSASKMYEGVQLYDGDYFVWSGGESYAPAHKMAKIYDLVARATRLGDAVNIEVYFKFDGHRASNEAQWTLSRSTGEVLTSRPWSNFGSQTDPFLGLTVFGARGWAASATEYVDGCDIVVVGNTEGKAWYEGFWDVGGISIGVNPTGPTGQINFSKGRRGETQAGASFNTQFTCPPPPDPGSGGGYGGGGDDCTVCQQWFLPIDEDWLIEWWECGPANPGECSDYVI